jgi:lactobin A/cerein 7B family class IIb bacteriocin
MTDLNNEVCELTVEELEAVSGGRIKIEKPPAVVAWEIAKVEADNPGFC